MKTCLFTGFKPFLNYPTNPTEELALELDGQALGEYKIHSKILPVAYQQAIVDMQDFAEFDLILLNGLAFERKTICLETHAYNQIDSSRPDNRGLILEKQTIQSGGQDVLSSSFASPLLLQLTAALRHRGHAIQLSKDPGRYLCNFIYYHSLFLLQNSSRSIPCLFIHWPPAKNLDPDSPFAVADYLKTMSDFFDLLMQFK